MAGPHTLSQAEHAQILADEILADASFREVTSQARPKAIILAGQPGAGKGNLERAAQADLGHNAVSIDPDALRATHPSHESLVANYPYTWADHTHPDASQWAKELRAEAITQRKNLIIDGTMPKADLIRELQSNGYEVEVRAVAAHRFESELGVDARFANGLDRDSFGRYVPEHIRTEVYRQLPAHWMMSPNSPGCLSGSTTAKATSTSIRGTRHRLLQARLWRTFGRGA
jgi:predicted ABC-type ATPase